jgi:type I restriction enzyme R subunit
MSVHTEVHFETEICEALGAQGWLYAEGDAANYDRARALYPDDVIAWIQTSQPDAWTALKKSCGSRVETEVLDRLRKQLDTRGTLDVLREGFEMMGSRGPIQMATFRPAMALNPDITRRYQANRLRVVRQVRYSLHHEGCLDLVFFLNGVPVATAELKSAFTQHVDDAIRQYRDDRKPTWQSKPEPLLTFWSGALVHFAVSNFAAAMTTRLDGSATTFLPFNRGNGGAAGNPPSESGHPTSYLWESVWQRESWLDILGRYLMVEYDQHKKPTKIIFPRFHQLEVTRLLLKAVREQGTGGRYLVQHSAGSGKTNSIAWTAHFLADLHDEQNKKVFDTVLVISDRNVIDQQLQKALQTFERTRGVVATITGEGTSKSGDLTEALSGAKKVVVCTIQTFPHALKEARRLAAAKGRRFAVIADEAHSSQTGETAIKLKQVLTPGELAELSDGGEISGEDVLAAEMAARANETAITFVAFTATPKGKTLELFGTRPDPTSPPSTPDNVPQPFHVYSMRQAIEEGFILDVLQNYMTYTTAFRLSQAGQEIQDTEVERSAALKKLMSWVRLHPHNIAQKVTIVVEHYRERVAHLLGGKAKAMVVVGSRQEAVRWQLATQKYIAEKGYSLGALVAFSGEVVDPESNPEPLSETSALLNPGLKGRQIAKAFDTGEYHLLLVANKFQTGFDQPLLCAMYVDKKLADIQAVQTLSRLNRAYPGKDTTFVLDFVNEQDVILQSFLKYYSTAQLSETTDPNIVFDLRAKLDACGWYDEFEVDRVARVELNPSSKPAELSAAIKPVYDRLMGTWKDAYKAHSDALERDDTVAATAAHARMDALVQFRGDMQTYVRVYNFLSQLYDFGNTALEKRALFYRRLASVLEWGRERESIDLAKVQLTHYVIRSKGKAVMSLTTDDLPMLDPITAAGTGGLHEKEKALLSEIIERVNSLFEGAVSDEDAVVYVRHVVRSKLLQDARLREQAANNTKAQFSASPDLDKATTAAILAASDAHATITDILLTDKAKLRALLQLLLDKTGLYEELRE